MSVLCGTDFSSGTHDAILVAAAFASRWDESLRLVHAMDVPVSLELDHTLSSHARDLAARRLDAEAELAREQGPPSVETSVEDGPPHEAIVAASTSQHVRLVVLGAVGSRVEPSRRTGRTAERVAATAKSPVLVVRNAPSLQAWLGGKCALKIVVGDDLTATSAAALRWAAALRQLGTCQIVVCHVFSLFEEKARLRIGGSLYARVPELEQASLAALRRHAVSIMGVEGVTYRVEGTLGRAAEPLLGIASDEAADLVVVGTGQRSSLGRAWHGWTSQIVLNDAPCNVACIPGGEILEEQPKVVPPVRRVLATTDFSPAANHAVAYAYAVVADGGTVHVLHVERADQPGDQRETTERMRRLIPELASGKKVETQLEVVSDPSVSAAITAAAERLDVDVICMGTHGRTFLMGAALGSVARAVAARCRRQTLLVPPLRAES